MRIATDRLLPGALRLRLRRLRRPIRFGSLRRTEPLSDHWGRERGQPIDRWYIERFLATHERAIRGRVLEVRDPGYVERFGHDVDRVDILDLDPTNPRATIVADLAVADSLPKAAFDALVVTQVLQYVADVPTALANLHEALVPGGSLLLTVPAIGRIGRSDLAIDLWRFTPTGLDRLLRTAFGDEVAIETSGNVLAAIAFLAGAAAEDLTEAELLSRDPSFPVIVAARAVRR